MRLLGYCLMPDHFHLVVWTRGDGTKALIIGSTADEIVGLSHAEGRALLARLLDWTAQPAFTYRHHWQEGDCVIWDNPSALHRVIPYALDSAVFLHHQSVTIYKVRAIVLT